MEGHNPYLPELTAAEISAERRRQYLLYAAAGAQIENVLPLFGLGGSGLKIQTKDQVYYV